jgi:hypothetical protein
VAGRQLARRSALLDALIGAIAVRDGALLVTTNIPDFSKVAEVMPLRVEGLASFTRRLRDRRGQDRRSSRSGGVER